MSRPNLSTPPEPETQIGLLKIQPSASKGIQTKPSVSTKNDQLEDMCARKPTRPSLVIPKCKRDTLIVPESLKSNIIYKRHCNNPTTLFTIHTLYKICHIMFCNKQL